MPLPSPVCAPRPACGLLDPTQLSSRCPVPAGEGGTAGRTHCPPTGSCPHPASSLLALRSYLAIPASSWVDDFIDWLTPSSCCRLYIYGPNKGEFCPSTVSEYGVSGGTRPSSTWEAAAREGAWLGPLHPSRALAGSVRMGVRAWGMCGGERTPGCGHAGGRESRT